MTVNRTYAAVGLVSVAAILAVLGACEPYEAETTGAQAFLLPGAHEALTCQECHGPPPYVSFVWDATCISCHDLDRKPNDAAHAGYQTCSGAGCHFDTDLVWATAAQNVDHDFLPLVGPHPIDNCAACHDSGTPSALDVFPVGGNSTYCWSCHEADRLLHPAGAGHYVDDPLVDPELLPDAEPRWDCKACHDQNSRGVELSSQWALFPINHGVAGKEIKVPHGTQGATRVSLTVREPFAITDPALWVVACVDCHPGAAAFDLATYTCTTACHAEIFEVVSGVSPLAVHASFTPGNNDGTCTLAACHPSADLRGTQL